jgi:hypothetical protein
VEQRDFQREFYEVLVERLKDMRANADEIIATAQRAGVDLTKEVGPQLESIDKQIAHFVAKITK